MHTPLNLGLAQPLTINLGPQLEFQTTLMVGYLAYVTETNNRNAAVTVLNAYHCQVKICMKIVLRE